MNKTALLIIDVQVAMFSYENEKPLNGDVVLKNIKNMLEKAREKKVPVIFVQHSETEEFERGTETWQICSEIEPLDSEPVIEKTTRDSFLRTSLKQTLQGLGIENLIIMGMQTEYCVDTTCRSAFSLGYKLILVRDAHTTFTSSVLTAEQIVNHHNNVLKGIANLKTTEEILEMLNG